MKNLRLVIIFTVLMVGLCMQPNLSHAQQTWQTTLAKRFVEAVSGIQQVCIQKAKIECELLEIEENPPLLNQGQIVDYVGVRNVGVFYWYLVVAERDDMVPEIYLFDSQGRLLNTGTGLRGGNLTIHIPEYTQKVRERIKMVRGSGHIGIAVLVPVGVR